MSYHLKDHELPLADVQRRIEETDLVPSRAALLNEIQSNFQRLSKTGINTLADLRKQIKNARQVPSFAKKAGIEEAYLILLRREIESYFPKPFPIRAFDWLPQRECRALDEAGCRNSQKIYDALCSWERRKQLSEDWNMDRSFLETLYCLVNLTRVQWISPLAARMMVSAGYDSPQKIANAEAEALCDAVNAINREHKFFQGNISLRDIKRLVHAAKYVT